MARAARRAWRNRDPRRLEREAAELRRAREVQQQLQEVADQVAAIRPARTGIATFEDLSLPLPPTRRGRLDVDDLDESTLDDDELAFRRDGFLIKPGLIPRELTEVYLRDRMQIDDDEFSVWGGSYMAIPSMRDLCLHPPLFDLVEKLIGEPLALFLTLSGLRSSRREWHQDFYLKPGYENLHYCAVWIALDDVDPASGPYEFVPGSHRLPTLRHELVHQWLTPEERAAVGAPRIAEGFVTGACEALIRERHLEVRRFVPRRGDVLVWHHSLLHQGSRPTDPELIRPGLIAHYNAIDAFDPARKQVERDDRGAFIVRTDQEDVLRRRRSAQPLVDASKRQRAEASVPGRVAVNGRLAGGMGRSAHADSLV